MAVSSHRILFVSTSALLSACSVGVGEGEITMTITARECELEDDFIQLDPTFFAADTADNILEIRAQHGSDFEDRSDGIHISVLALEDVKRNRLDLPIALEGRTGDVLLSLYLNEHCMPERDVQPVAYLATSGTITFEAIYAPDVNSSEREIAATFSDVHAVDTSQPTERFADLNGYFAFIFTRGRPAQRFP